MIDLVTGLTPRTPTLKKLRQAEAKQRRASLFERAAWQVMLRGQAQNKLPTWTVDSTRNSPGV